MAVAFAVLVFLGATSGGQAEILTATPDNYLEKVRGLKPGDALELQPGAYLKGLPLHAINGTVSAPIVIQAADPHSPPLFIASPERNTVSLRDASYIVIRDLELDGRGLLVSGVKAEGDSQYTHHITLENLHISHYSASQQAVAISTKCPSWNWIIRGNRIEDVGTGIYLGNSDGSAPFVAGIIENNVITGTIGYDLQVKHQLPRPNLPGLPEGKTVTIIRHNLFAKDGRSSTAEMARPNVLVGHWPKEGPGKDDTYLIYGNTFWQNPTEALFQGEGNVALYNNLFVNRAGDAVHIQPHNDKPKHVEIFHNTVIARDQGIRVLLAEGQDAHAVRITGNAVFAAKPIVGGISFGNRVGSAAAAVDALKKPDAPLESLDLHPQSPTGFKAEMRLPLELEAFLGADQDFDGVRGNFQYLGAYAKPSSVNR